MTTNEFAKIAAVIRTSYPERNVLTTPEAMDTWYAMLKDLDYAAAQQAVTQWIMTNPHPPLISNIRQSVVDVARGELPDWGQGWLEVKKAIAHWGYMNGTSAIAEMSEITAEVVKRMGWMQLCMGEDEVADRANFRMIYEELVKRKQREEQTPDYLKKLIEQTRSQMPKMLGEMELENDRGRLAGTP